jgi:hypothetical protein
VAENLPPQFSENWPLLKVAPQAVIVPGVVAPANVEGMVANVIMAGRICKITRVEISVLPKLAVIVTGKIPAVFPAATTSVAMLFG